MLTFTLFCLSILSQQRENMNIGGSQRGVLRKLADEGLIVRQGKNNVSIAIDQNDLAKLTSIYNSVSPKFRHSVLRAGFEQAIQLDRSPMVRYLLSQEGSRAIRIHGMTLLSYAAFCGAVRSVSFLAVETNNAEKDKEGRIALHYAVVSGPRILRKLAICSSLVNSRDLYGRTPLHYAFKSSQDSVGYLLRSGANCQIKDNLDAPRPLASQRTAAK